MDKILVIILTIMSIDVACFDVSYNLPEFCPNATWDAYGITFTAQNTIGSSPVGIFVDINNTFYLADTSNDRVLVWLERSTNPTRSLSVTLKKPMSLFITTNGDIYVDNGQSNHEVDKWTLNATSGGVNVMAVSHSCYGLFIDLNDTLYCSIQNDNQVLKQFLQSNGTSSAIIAGTGSSGSTSTQLRAPGGICVDFNFNLYVADSNNDRIQRFASGQPNGATVAGNGVGTISLNTPTDVVLDADGYLFIVDSKNNRIIGQGSYGFRCLVGCSTSSGSNSDQFNQPQSISFDNNGNMFVSDTNNNRIQKFLLANNSCNSTQPTQNVDTTTTLKSNTLTATIADSTFSSIMTTLNQTIITSTDSTSSETMATNKTSVITTTATSMITNSYLTTSLSSIPLPTNFVPPACSNLFQMGSNCNISSAPCDLLTPCENAGTCVNNISALNGYICQCQPDFNGTYCELDFRPCKPNTCWNNGTCLNISNSDYLCVCAEGWTGIQCEAMVNYCQNVTCKNNGVCRPLFRAYKCECLGTSYSGGHCEITASSLTIRQIVAKSFGYIAIIFIISVFVFVGTLDVLKYIFHIDPAGGYRKRKEHKKPRKKRQQSIIALRFIYVHTLESISVTKQATK